MKFKNATIDVRFSRESGTDRSGRYAHGETFTARCVYSLFPGMPVDLIRSGPEVARLEIRQYNDDQIDGEIFLNGQFAYAFSVDGIVKDNYTSVRFYLSGFWYILEYRFLGRENS